MRSRRVIANSRKPRASKLPANAAALWTAGASLATLSIIAVCLVYRCGWTLYSGDAEAHLMIAKAVDQGRSITPAAEWLVDNYHIIEAQIREIEADLPPGYYRLLPKLASGPFAGYPCVFGLSWAFIAQLEQHDNNFPFQRTHRDYIRPVRSDSGNSAGRAREIREEIFERLDVNLEEP